MWRPQVDEFEREFRVVAPNLPGFGGTEPVGPALRMDYCADVIAALLREQSLHPVTVCGLSMGGYVAMEIWRRHPDLVSGLVLANTKASPDDEAARERRRQLAQRLRKEGSGFLLENPPPLLSDHAPGELETFVKNIMAAQPPESIAAAALGMAGRADSTDLLPGIFVPTLVLSSEKDTLIPPDVTREMAEAIPNARFVMLTGAGHLSNLEAAEQFNEALHAHLLRVRVYEHERIPRPPQGIRVRPLP
jgi:pimeloyl-ACP methyl ester carboxylesterase